MFYILSIILLSCTQHAHALEKLNFQNKIFSPSLKLQMNTYFQEQYKIDSSVFDIAAADLNKDGVDEYIFRRKSCSTANTICTHIILAQQNQKILLLSSIRARHLMIGGTTNFGISDLLAFKDEINDYNFDIYMWSSAEKMYILSEDKQKN